MAQLRQAPAPGHHRCRAASEGGMLLPVQVWQAVKAWRDEFVSKQTAVKGEARRTAARGVPAVSWEHVSNLFLAINPRVVRSHNLCTSLRPYICTRKA